MCQFMNIWESKIPSHQQQHQDASDAFERRTHHENRSRLAAELNVYRLTIWSCTDQCAWPSASPVCGRWPSPSPWNRCRLRRTAPHLPVGHTGEETRCYLGETLSGWAGELTAKRTGSKRLGVSQHRQPGWRLNGSCVYRGFLLLH